MKLPTEPTIDTSCSFCTDGVETHSGPEGDEPQLCTHCHGRMTCNCVKCETTDESEDE